MRVSGSLNSVDVPGKWTRLGFVWQVRVPIQQGHMSPQTRPCDSSSSSPIPQPVGTLSSRVKVGAERRKEQLVCAGYCGRGLTLQAPPDLILTQPERLAFALVLPMN